MQMYFLSDDPSASTCNSNPCMNGTCADDGAGHICSCYDGFEGGNCESTPMLILYFCKL